MPFGERGAADIDEGAVRPERRCSMCATISFPVPDSPVMSTGRIARRTRAIISTTACSGAYCVSISTAPAARSSCDWSSTFSRARRRFSHARRTSTSISAMPIRLRQIVVRARASWR
jgi:hypothetical protein